MTETEDSAFKNLYDLSSPMNFYILSLEWLGVSK